MDNDTIKTGIRKVRNGLGYSQRRMAEELGVSRSTYVNMENGTTHLINENLCRLAEIGDITPEELVLGYKPVRPEDMNSLEQENSRYLKGLEKVETEYKAEIKNLSDKVASLEDLVRTLQETVATQKEMMAMYKKMINFEA